MRDTFIDRIYPLRVMTMISNALHSWVEKHSRRPLAEHETNIFKTLNESVLITNKELDRNAAVTEIMEGCKDVESRKMKILSEIKKKTSKAADPGRSSSRILDPNLPVVAETPTNKQ